MKKLIKSPSVSILVVLIVLTVSSIFIHSLMSPSTSSKESEAVGGVVEEVVETVAPNNVTFKDFVKKNIRKIAHFAEFGALGVEACALAIVLLHKKGKRGDKLSQSTYINAAAVTIIFALLVAFLDESLQLISKRGPLIEDVWLDLLGFSSFSLISLSSSLVVFAAVKLIKSRKTRRAFKTSGNPPKN